MAEVITLIDGKNEIVRNLRDMQSLVEKYMGFEAYRFLRDCLDENEKELSECRSCYKDLEDLRDKGEELVQSLERQCNSLDDVICCGEFNRVELERILKDITESVRGFEKALERDDGQL